jgi:hypothetical protein
MVLASDLAILIRIICITILGDGIIGVTTLGLRHSDTTLGDIILGDIMG